MEIALISGLRHLHELGTSHEAWNGTLGTSPRSEPCQLHKSPALLGSFGTMGETELGYLDEVV
jgi:hypothetical protein